jgi:hypothetical protein
MDLPCPDRPGSASPGYASAVSEAGGSMLSPPLESWSGCPPSPAASQPEGRPWGPRHGGAAGSSTVKVKGEPGARCGGSWPRRLELRRRSSARQLLICFSHSRLLTVWSVGSGVRGPRRWRPGAGDPASGAPRWRFSAHSLYTCLALVASIVLFRFQKRRAHSSSDASGMARGIMGATLPLPLRFCAMLYCLFVFVLFVVCVCVVCIIGRAMPSSPRRAALAKASGLPRPRAA